MTMPYLDLARTLATIPRIDQFLGAWAIEPRAGEAFVDHVRGLDLARHMAAWQDVPSVEARRGDAPRYALERDSIAVIPIHGILTKYGSSLTAGMLDHRRALREAERDAAVRGILLHLDTPGGNSHGLDDLAREITRVSQTKPVWAYCEDLCASAGYYLATHCTRIHANDAAWIGSIGVYTWLLDLSRLYEEYGVVVHRIRAGGPHKGVGLPGTPITEEERAEVQRCINEINARFVQAVQSGRGFTAEEAAALNTGQVWGSPDALRLRLIDHIGTLDDALAALSHQISTGRQARATAASNRGGSSMTVSIHDLRAALPGAEPGFLVQLLEEGVTLEEAARRHLVRLETQIRDLESERDTLAARVAELETSLADKENELRQLREERAAAATPRRPDPVQHVSPATVDGLAVADPVSRYQLAYRELKASGLSDREVRTRLAAEQPQLVAAAMQHASSAQAE